VAPDGDIRPPRKLSAAAERVGSLAPDKKVLTSWDVDLCSACTAVAQYDECYRRMGDADGRFGEAHVGQVGAERLLD
jgi:hypothetical protein